MLRAVEKFVPWYRLVLAAHRAHAYVRLQMAVTMFILFIALPPAYAAALNLTAARLWPAEEYTRLTLEAPAPVAYEFMLLKNPQRIVLDLKGVELNAVLEGLAAKVLSTDPYIGKIRVGRFKPGVVRLVLDLKAEVKPNVFAIAPAGEYGHRLVLDLYPAHPADPLLALLTEPPAKPVEITDPDAKLANSLPLPVLAKEGSSEPQGPLAPEQIAQTAQTPQPAVAKENVAKLMVIAPGPDKPVSKPTAALARPLVVAIDAGHGGEDPGAKGASGALEKNVTLAIARRLKAQIDAEPNMRAVLVRDGDYFIALQQRVHKARRLQADLFVSIHADSFITPDARGSSVFALSERGATSAAARWLANRENAADLIGGVNIGVRDPYLAKTLLDLSQTATINDSLKLAKAVLGELGEINPLHKGSVEQAGFAVLKSPDIPSILVETAFISNPDEEQRLTDPSHQTKIAEAIVAGIQRYFAKNPPLAKPKVAANL